MARDRIERETVIAAPVEQVWTLLTDPDHVGTWFGDAGAEIDLRPGGAIVIRWTEHGTVRGRFERIEPHRLLSYRWARDLTGAEPAERSSTLVEFTLTPEGAGTRLRVVETGFAALAGSEEERARAAEGNLEGWGIKLRDIEDYLQRAPV